MFWRTKRILVAHKTESVMATGHELSVEMSSFKSRAGIAKTSLFISLCPTVRDNEVDCTAERR